MESGGGPARTSGSRALRAPAQAHTGWCGPRTAQRPPDLRRVAWTPGHLGSGREGRGGLPRGASARLSLTPQRGRLQPLFLAGSAFIQVQAKALSSVWYPPLCPSPTSPLQTLSSLPGPLSDRLSPPPGSSLSVVSPWRQPSWSPTPFYQPRATAHSLSFLAPEPGWPELRRWEGAGEAGGLSQACPFPERSTSTGLVRKGSMVSEGALLGGLPGEGLSANP